MDLFFFFGGGGRELVSDCNVAKAIQSETEVIFKKNESKGSFKLDTFSSRGEEGRRIGYCS